MENLQITGSTRRSIRCAGNMVLAAEFPTVSGDTPAAVHTEALLAALWKFTESVLAPRAEQALLNAAKAGQLFAFRPYKIAVKVEKKSIKRGVLLSLSLSFYGGEQESLVTRNFLWQADETLRLRARKSRKKTQKNA